jgi:stage II sporulation protein D
VSIRRDPGILLTLSVLVLCTGWTLSAMPGPQRQIKRSAERIVQVTFPLKIRVGLMVAQEQVKVTGRGAFRARCGGKIIDAAGGEVWTARRLTSIAARTDFLPVIATFEWAQEAEARELAKKWLGLGYEANVLPAGIEMVSDAGPVNDTRRHYVTVGRFDDAASAREFMQTLVAMGETPWLHERLLAAQGGEVALVDPSGVERARGDGVAFESDRALKVFRVHHDVGFPQEGFEDREYEGGVLVAFDKHGKLAAVNLIDLDLYLQGVVPSEVFSGDPTETLRTQAVAARGETLAHIGLSGGTEPYDICSDQNCQVYTGLKLQTPGTTDSVQVTRGEVLKHSERIVQTFFASTCGGHSESVENVWGSAPHPSLVGVPDVAQGQSTFPQPLTEAGLAAWLASSPPAYCRGEGASVNPHYRWTVTLTAAEVDQRINKVHAVGNVRKLVPVSRGVSGRLKALQVVGSKATVTIQKELAIRRALGGLKSALFVVESKEESGRVSSWTFRGAGFGHGVGMCQVGARWAARAGLTYRQILPHYYRGATITRIYE